MNGLFLCKSRLLFQFKNLFHIITTRKVDKNTFNIDELDMSFKNERFKDHYNLLSQNLGLDLNKFIFTDQVHSNKVEYVNSQNLIGEFYKNVIKETDGLITDEKGIFLTTKYADCMPIIAYDPIKNVVGVAHSGWRGTLIDMPKHLIIKMINEFGSFPENIFVSIGPSIGTESFEVGFDVAEKFIKKFGERYVIKKENRYFVNLWGIVEDQIYEMGVRNIEVSMIDTFKYSNYFYSYRKEKTNKRFSVIVSLIH
jgi:hypothetical protein